MLVCKDALRRDTSRHNRLFRSNRLTSDLTEKSPPQPHKPEPGTSDTPEPTKVPVDTEAQEEAGKVREKSGGYD